MSKTTGSGVFVMLGLIAALMLGLPIAALFVPSEAPLPTRIQLSRSNTLVIEGGINTGRGTNLADVQRAMVMQLTAEDVQQIDIVIDSPGGAYTQETETFLSYMDYLATQKIKTRCIVLNMSASLATIVLSHCTERYAIPSSVIMFHAARIGGVGRMNQFEAGAIAKGLAELDALVWAPMRDLIDDSEYWDVNFKAERLIPATELALRDANIVTILESIELVD